MENQREFWEKSKDKKKKKDRKEVILKKSLKENSDMIINTEIHGQASEQRS